jgi:polysaccharide biosynthesis/export protein
MFQFCKVCHSNVAASRHSIGGRKWVNLSMVLLLLLLPRIAPAQENFNKTQKSGQQLVVRNENGNKDVQDAVSVDPKYSIGPQDVLSISVWKESDLTQTVVVRPDGRISLPLVNDVQAAGLTPMQLAGSVTAELRKYLSDPRVTVVVTQINSQRIYVLGEVNKAGAYALFPGMSFLQALSSAGGFTQFADVKKIYLLRTENGGQAKFLFNYKEVVHGRAPEQNIALRTGDTIIVP